LADVFYLPYGEMVTNLGYDFLNSEQKWPNVARWWRDVSTRDSWTTVKDGIPTEGLQA
jgi:glutathione S-transferase